MAGREEVVAFASEHGEQLASTHPSRGLDFGRELDVGAHRYRCAVLRGGAARALTIEERNELLPSRVRFSPLLLGNAHADFAGKTIDEDVLAAQTGMLEAQIETESTALYATGRVWDDGIIHPADSRTVMGIALSAVHGNVVQGATDYGVWRH